MENLDEILDVPGIDVLFVGPYDLSSSLGHVGEIDHPEVIACIQGIIEKANAKGVKLAASRTPWKAERSGGIWA